MRSPCGKIAAPKHRWKATEPDRHNLRNNAPDDASHNAAVPMVAIVTTTPPPGITSTHFTWLSWGITASRLRDAASQTQALLSMPAVAIREPVGKILRAGGSTPAAEPSSATGLTAGDRKHVLPDSPVAPRPVAMRTRLVHMLSGSKSFRAYPDPGNARPNDLQRRK